MNIFLVDDDEVIRMGMRKLIEKAEKGWQVAGEASDGEIALNYLDSHSDVDVVICDVRMPIMDGLELVRIIRQERDYDPKIVMLSGYNEFEFVRSAFMNGVCDYILKPFKKDEFIALLENIEGRLKKERQLEQTVSENNDFLVSEILKKLSKCGPEEAASSIKKLDNLGIKTDYKYFATLRVMVDQYYKQFSAEGQYNRELNLVMEKVVSLGAAKKGFDFIHCIFKQEILILVFSEDGEKLMEFAKKLHSILNKGDDEVSVTVAISNVYEDFGEMSESFAESEKAIMSRFYLGQNKFILYGDVAGKCIDMQYDIEPAVKDLVHNINLCDYMKSKEIMDRVFIDLSYCNADKFRKYIHDIIDMLSLRIENFGYFVAINSSEINFYIDYLNTFRELKTYMNSLLQNVIEYINGEREKRSKRRIEMAKEYISVHYYEPFTLNDIAEHVELNPSYFSNLFKTETGINFSEYLLNVRMDKAKELLRDPKIKVYEIGNLVGYDDAVSFGRAFKKKWGISPKEYRNSVY
ncbi:MAG: response regulator [Acetatifactor sp.]|nr:response regulator [Acetatifactor sp.]